MAKKSYTVNEDEKTISACMGTLTAQDKQDIEFLCKLGYTFEVKTRRKRQNGSTRKRPYYKANLSHPDYVEFEAIAEGSYPRACAWANALISLGKSGDEESLNEFRAIYAEDKAMGRIFLKNWVDARKREEKRAMKEARLAA